MEYHLAQINIGRVVAATDDGRMAGFMEQLEPLNRLADGAPGFVWRLQGYGGNATDVAYGAGPMVLVNLSVWETLEALRNYTYGAEHAGVLRDRARWFVKMDKAHACLWWVPAGHVPTVAEGKERLEYYQEHGATPYAFWFSRSFPAPEGRKANA